MEQNIIAIIWDFDKTLIDGYMQTPIFELYNVDESQFWKEINMLKEEYTKQGIKINKDTIYLNHILTCVQQGIFKGLNNKILYQMGAKLKFYKGIPEILERISEEIQSNPNYQTFNISVEHYIVSTGLAEVIKGSEVYKYVKSIWGCEFIEKPIKSSLLIKEYEKETQDTKETELSQIGYAIDNTSKTRAIFEINKGSNLYDIDVNSRIEEERRRVPFENMIYIADGPSDVPAFSVLRKNGGRTFAIYPRGDIKAFKQVDQLRRDGRIDMFGEADYSEGTTTYMWLMEHVNQIAMKICNKKIDQIKRNVSKAPEHIND